MTNDEKDAVTRTLERYAPQIARAMDELRRERPSFGVYEDVTAKYDGQSITGITFNDLKLLEGKLQELTGDSEAKLVRTLQEYKDASLRSRMGLIARFEADDKSAALYIEDELNDAKGNKVDRDKIRIAYGKNRKADCLDERYKKQQ